MPYIGNEPADRFTSIPTVQQFNGDGSTTAFTLSRTVSSDQDILVSVDGVIQDTAAYAVSNGTTLTFSAAPSTGTANIFVNHLGLTIGSVVHPASSALVATTGTFNDALSAKGGAVFNEDSADVDFRVESDTGTHALFVQGSDGNVGIGTDTITNPYSQTPHTNVNINGTWGGVISFKLGGTEMGWIGQRSSGNSDMVLGASSGQDLLFYTNGVNERMRIDLNGHVTMPTQPAFLARPTSNQDNIAINTDVTVVLGTELFDVGANFASNLFTAPVTGKYQISFCLNLRNLDSAAAYYEVQIVTSNRNYNFIIDPDFGQDAVYWAISGSALCDMDASDTARFKVVQSGGTAQTDISTESHFSGYLVA